MREEKVFYVSDLDGTLLNSGQALSAFTVNTINSLVGQGMLFPMRLRVPIVRQVR